MLCGPWGYLARPTRDHPGSHGGKRLQQEPNGFTGGWGVRGVTSWKGPSPAVTPSWFT